MRKASYILIIFFIVLFASKLWADEKGVAKVSPLIFSNSDKEYSYNYYKGKITVSGTISLKPYDGPVDVLGGVLCMWVDKDTSYLIPRINDHRAAWFCLDPDKALFAKMKIDRNKIKDKCFSGFAKIQVTNYRQYIGGSSGNDEAKLVKVVKINNYSYKECLTE